jgi:hypothetical protein
MNWLDWQFEDNGIVELIHMPEPRILRRGFFDTREQLVRVARSHQQAGNLFVSLNRPAARYIPNDFVGGHAMKDDQVERITRIPFDFDPVRADGFKGHPSTEAELNLARERLTGLFRHMQAFTGAIPATAVSGNGIHVIYRTALPNTQETAEALRAVYRGFKALLSDDAVEFDTTVCNPARFFPLYGSIKRKGVASATRPHRRTAIDIPQGWRQVSRREVMNLADYFARLNVRDRSEQASAGERGIKPTGSGDYKTLDIVSLFESHGLYLRPGDDVKHFVICPWSGEHSDKPTPNDTSTVIYESGPNQWPSFRCLHSHCDHRRIAEVINHFSNTDDYCGQQWSKDKWN